MLAGQPARSYSVFRALRLAATAFAKQRARYEDFEQALKVQGWSAACANARLGVWKRPNPAHELSAAAPCRRQRRRAHRKANKVAAKQQRVSNRLRKPNQGSKSPPPTLAFANIAPVCGTHGRFEPAPTPVPVSVSAPGTFVACPSSCRLSRRQSVSNATSIAAQRVLHALLQHALEMRGVVRLQHAGFARQIKVPQARYPESQRRSPHHVGQQRAFHIR